jgi:hypothetical protein
MNPDPFFETRDTLRERARELRELQGILATGDASALDRHALVVDQIRELKKTYQEQLDLLSTELPRGRRLFTPQYEALERFAKNNKIGVTGLLPQITIKGNVIVECRFGGYDWIPKLTTLDGLQELSTVRKLDISHNYGLPTLKGIPTQQLENLDASSCALVGDLTELRNATKLNKLDVSANPLFNSLDGICAEVIEELQASECSLAGDLSVLSQASKLKRLDVSQNRELTSLTGVPTQALQDLDASWCSLIGDHTFLSSAPNLRRLSLEVNPKKLSLDRSQFASNVEISL